MSSQEANGSMEEGDAGNMLLKPLGNDVIISSLNSDEAAVPMVEGEETTVLETVEERRARRRSHYVVYFTTFIGSVGFSIVLTGVWPYLQQLDPGVSKEFLGWVIAANPLGQMITSPILGLWANKAGSIRGPLIFAVVLFILGNVLYAILNIFGHASLAFMVFARFLIGVSFANMAIIRSYVAASTTTVERTSAVAFTSAAQGGGFIIGPALQAAIVVAFRKEKIESTNSTMADALAYQVEGEEEFHIEWNMYTAAGWSAAVLGIVNFFLFLPCVFQEHPIAAKEALLLKKAANESNTRMPDPDYRTVISVLLSFFIVQFVFVLIEVVLVPMCIDMYAWSDETALTVIGVGLCVAGLVATVMFASVGVLARKFDERKVYIFLGLVPLLISMICFVPMGNTYPKMQNCTMEANQSHHRDVRSIPSSLPYHLEVIKNQLHPLNYITKFRDNLVIEEYSPESKYEITSARLSGVSELYLAEAQFPFNETSDQYILSRRRRRIRREKKCVDTGCPQEQEWCNYTPIIEQSQMLVACFVAFIGYPVAFSLSSALYSKLLGPKPQGVWMGILTSTGSFSRMTGPIFVTYMYTVLGTRWTFGVLVIIMTFVIVFTLTFFKRLVPLKVTRD